MSLHYFEFDDSGEGPVYGTLNTPDVWSGHHLTLIRDAVIEGRASAKPNRVMEFELEKNGVRFPSRFVVEEAYINKKGKRFVMSEINIVYKNYRFFTVDLDTPIIMKNLHSYLARTRPHSLLSGRVPRRAGLYSWNL